MTGQSSRQQVSKNLPKKWAFGLVVATILYVLLQPVANSRWGWNLPSLASLVGSEVAPANNIPAVATPIADPAAITDQTETRGTADSPKSVPPSEAKTNGDPNLKYGLLKDLGRETYLSPAGLRYTKGSQEGHRLKHLERHLTDLPNRPGKHGVFEGGMEQTLRWIDDAYTRGQRGAKGVTKRLDEGRTIYEVPFSKPIGYIGGRDGKRDHHPDAKRLRLIVEGDQFITGFPF